MKAGPGNALAVGILAAFAALAACGDNRAVNSAVCGDDGTPCAVEPRCGDGQQDIGEECDDGNAVSSDGCSPDCRHEPRCGDGAQDPGEQCDDGNTADGDDCDAACMLPACGDGIVDPGEACDDGNTVEGDACDSNCTAPGCGNGIVDPGEQCDDDNTAADDGCSATCTLEVDPMCGDGHVDLGEACDDGNAVNSDCCSDTCGFEAGCELEPNDDVASANEFAALAISGRVKAFIAPTNDRDWFAIVVPPGPNADLSFEVVDGPQGTTCESYAIDTLLEVYSDPFVAPIAADDDGAGAYCSLVTVANAPPGTYYLLARAFSPHVTFDYTVQATITPVVCGNGVAQYGEECDDSNVVGGDGCDPDCQREPSCGDGFIDAPEQCEDGNLVAGDCCTSCGIDAGCEIEPNDDAATANDFAAVSVGGRVAAVITDPNNPYDHDDQDWFTIVVPPVPSDLRLEIGDGVLGSSCANNDIQVWPRVYADPAAAPLVEQGGGQQPGGCPWTYFSNLTPGTYYVMVSGWSFDYTLEATVLPIVCGDGIVESGEECDDANAVAGDGCDPTCQREPVCGDGWIDSPEQCEDGNLVAGDGCASCIAEAGGEIEPNDDWASANDFAAVSVGGRVGAILLDDLLSSPESSSDRDWFTFVVPPGQYANLHLAIGDGLLGSTCLSVPELSVYADPAATPIAQAAYYCPTLDVNGLAAGTYYVMVRGYPLPFTQMLPPLDYTLAATLTLL